MARRKPIKKASSVDTISPEIEEVASRAVGALLSLVNPQFMSSNTLVARVAPVLREFIDLAGRSSDGYDLAKRMVECCFVAKVLDNAADALSATEDSGAFDVDSIVNKKEMQIGQTVIKLEEGGDTETNHDVAIDESSPQQPSDSDGKTADSNNGEDAYESDDVDDDHDEEEVVVEQGNKRRRKPDDSGTKSKRPKRQRPRGNDGRGDGRERRGGGIGRG